uniref:mucin-3B-like n=1 Tax=Epinephelus lanceolatus TaxID=310571 RepID=UPI0014469F15|nr:mucin-3B-like [Epinephelus lanceolatus]
MSSSTEQQSTSATKTTPTATTKSLTSAKITSTTKSTTVSRSTSTIITSSSTTVTVPSSTTPQCEDCKTNCTRGTCIFNSTLGKCQCNCFDFLLGDKCSFGKNDTPAHVDSGAIPTHKANITMKISVTFQVAFNNLNSPQSLAFINTLEKELEALCREADPQTFEKVKVIKLSPGSVVAESQAEYIYPNNETQIQFVNNKLDGVLTDILNNTSNLKKISQAFNNSKVLLNGLTFQKPEIKNITDLKPFINCSEFANYTAEIVNGQWQCAGPCKTSPDYCHQHGECHNDIKKGPVCQCFSSSLEQFHGPQCELFRRGPGFWGALFGSLAGALLLFIIIVIAVIVKKRYTGSWKRSNPYDRRLSAFEEDFFDFSDTGDHNLGFAGTYTSEGFRPHLKNVDTRMQATTKRPEVGNIDPR